MFKNKKVLAYALVIVTSLVATFSFYFWQVVKSPNINVDGQRDFELLIPHEADYDQVVDSLRKYKIITDDIAFGFLTKFMGYRENIKPGRYMLPPNSGNKEIISKLRAGDEDAVKLTFNNIRLKEELVNRLGNQLSFNKDELKELLNSENTFDRYGFSEETIMSMFLPDTYFIYWSTTAEGFLDRMKSEYDKFWNTERLAKAQKINFSPVEVATMASIIQSETNKKDEMNRIAGVYVNRIKQGIPLQADPTVKFAVGDFTLRRILNKHLRVQSPYNTYLNSGLPPGPIALPEKVAQEAVLNFEEHDFLYFCAREDFSGYHSFAADLAGHNRNARRYHAALNKRGIK